MSMENHPLLNMYWMPKMHENLIKAILISAFSKSSIKSLARTITSIFRLVFRQIQAYNHKCRFSTDDSTFWVVQNKPVTDSINKLRAYGALWVKNIKDNVMRLNKQLIKDADGYLFQLFHS